MSHLRTSEVDWRPHFTNKIEISIEDSAASHPEETSTKFRYTSETSYRYDPHFEDLDIASSLPPPYASLDFSVIV